MKLLTAIFMVLVLVILLPLSASAQIRKSAGLKAGLCMANISNAKGMKVLLQGDKYSTRHGFSGYGFLSIQFIDLFGAQIEVGYVMKGTKTKFTTMEGNVLPYIVTVVAAMSADYIEIPILTKLYLPDPTFNTYIYVGPSIGILLSATANGLRWDTTENIKKNMMGTDVGLAFGGGARFPIGLLFDFRYTRGFTTILKQETGNAALM